MSTGRESAGGDGQYRDGSDHSGDNRDQSPNDEDRAALDQVLKETLNALSHEQITAREIEALRDVARRYPNSSLNVDPITCELVDTLLRHRGFFQASGKNDDKEIAREIASCLHEAPASQGRLENLWDKLRETIQ